jgi:hypothetical protein
MTDRIAGKDLPDFHRIAAFPPLSLSIQKPDILGEPWKILINSTSIYPVPRCSLNDLDEESVDRKG